VRDIFESNEMNTLVVPKLAVTHVTVVLDVFQTCSGGKS